MINKISSRTAEGIPAKRNITRIPRPLKLFAKTSSGKIKKSIRNKIFLIRNTPLYQYSK